jgi:predicted RNase H-like HicB family nuclease
MRYAMVIERGDNSYSAYLPDLPGCVTTGNTVEELKHNMQGFAQKFRKDAI